MLPTLVLGGGSGLGGSSVISPSAISDDGRRLGGQSRAETVGKRSTPDPEEVRRRRLAFLDKMDKEKKEKEQQEK